MEFQKISLIQMEQIKDGIKRRLENEGKMLTPPTYTAKLPGGATQTFTHTKESAHGSSDEEKAAWDLYEKNFAEYDAEVQRKCMEYAFAFGVKGDPTQEWREKQEWLGIEYSNKFAEKAAYVMTELLITPESLRDGFLTILKISAGGVNKSVVEAAEATFRN